MVKLEGGPSDGSGSTIYGLVWKIPPKISSGLVKKYLDQRLVGLLFTAGQNYARVWVRAHLYGGPLQHGCSWDWHFLLQKCPSNHTRVQRVQGGRTFS